MVITIERPRPGRKLGKKCRKATPKLKKRKRCTLFKNVGTLTRKNLKKGKNTTKFSGRIGKRKTTPAVTGPRSWQPMPPATARRSKKKSFRVVRR